MTDEEKSAAYKQYLYQQYQAGHPLTPTQDKPTGPSAVVETLHAAKRLLDYSRGMTGGAAGVMLDSLAGTPSSTPAEDEAAMNLRGDFPDSATRRRRLGEPEGHNLSQMLPDVINPYNKDPSSWMRAGGPLDPSELAMKGFATDTAEDPLTYLSMGRLPLAKLAAKILPARMAARALPIISPLTEIAEKAAPFASPLTSIGGSAGEAMIKSGYKPIIEAATAAGSKNAAEDLPRLLGWGSNQTLRQRGVQVASQLKNQRDAIDKAAGEAGAEVSKADAMQPLRDYVEEIKAHGDTLNPAAILENPQVVDYAANASTKPASQTYAKIGFDKNVPNGMAAPSPKLSPEANASFLMRSGIKDAVENAVEKALPESGLQATNADLGTLLNSRGALRSAAKREMSAKPVTKADAILSALGSLIGLHFGHGLEGTMIGAATSKGINALNSTAFKTGGGTALQNLSKWGGPVADVAARNAFTQSQSPDDPWSGLSPEEKQAIMGGQ